MNYLLKNYKQSITMKEFKYTILSALISLVFVVPSYAKSPVWKVSKGDDYIYLGGTIHLLSEKDYPLPNAFQVAYAKTDTVVLEADIQALQAPELQQKLLNAISYQDHRALSNVLDREVYKKFDELLKERNLPIAVFDKFTPAGAIMTLSQYELGRLALIDGEGVDLHFAKRASKDDKESLYLETVDEQLSFIQSMNQLDPNTVIKSGIEEIGSIKEVWQSLLSAWRSGDLAKLEELGIEDMQKQFPNLYQIMLANRNRQWLDDIDSLMQNREKEFILVGALHMAGEDGLVSQLKGKGFKLEQLD